MTTKAMENAVCTNCETDNLSTVKYCKKCGYELPKYKQVSNINKEQDLKPVKKNKSKFLLPTIAGIFSFFISFYAIDHFFFKTQSFDKVMMSIADEINKICPLMVDAETRLDNAIAIPPNSFQYNYTLINTTREMIDTLEMKKNLELYIINNIRTNPEMKLQREKKIDIIYYYKDKNGNYLFMICATPEKYLLE